VAGAVARYADDRDRPALEGTSRISVDLKYGCLHPRQVLTGLGGGDGAATFASELAWRDFYATILAEQPETARQPLREEMGAIRVDEGPDADARFEAWAAGRTGYPIVDAGMRQLLGEAWVHNRVRMIVASFLVKDLHLDWRRGARHFLRHLQDGDLASNNHGWQWVAGTGTDAAPYFRVFNPVTQGRKFDPTGSTSDAGSPSCGTWPAVPSTSRGPSPTPARARCSTGTRRRSSTTPASGPRRSPATRPCDPDGRPADTGAGPGTR
jgi:deoxyribodipyrimidine photo-lyase